MVVTGCGMECFKVLYEYSRYWYCFVWGIRSCQKLVGPGRGLGVGWDGKYRSVGWMGEGSFFKRKLGGSADLGGF